jgi:hypothetical protein
MLASHPVRLALGVTCLSLACVPSALAAAPATVTIRVEGATQTLVPPTQVTTTTAPVVKDGNPKDSCAGTTALGALELATSGNWSGPWDTSFNQYVVNSIEGESHAFFSGAFWELWINHVSSEKGACEAPVEAGQEILFAPCPEAASECPTLGVEAPASANVGEPVAVTVKKYNKSGEGSDASGASVNGASGVATTDATGRATLTFSSAGTVPVQVSAPESIHTETSVCVHAGNDGSCGTTAPSGSSTTTTATGSSGTLGEKTSVGPKAIVARLTGLIDSHRYPRGDAPRVLAGSVTAASAVTSISLRLRRTYRGRCWAYDGKRERFLRVRCRQGSFFRVATTGDSFSYLLPARLPAGRYVLDIRASDAAGAQTTLARGTSRIVFYVS